MKSYSEEMEEQLEPRPQSRLKVVGQVQDEVILSEFFSKPSAHETWIRNRVPRGTHYDSADDGPEVEIVRTVKVSEVVDAWLSPRPSWPADRMPDVLNDGRA